MAIVKKTFSGDHDLVAPRNALTGELIHPGVMSPEMLETWEQDTHSLQGLGSDLGKPNPGPYLPDQAGYHDAIVRASNAVKHGPDEGSLRGYSSFPERITDQVFAGPWTGDFDYSSLKRSKVDPSTVYNSSPYVHMKGDYRAGGLDVVKTSRNPGSEEDDDPSFTTTYVRNIGNAAAYSRGVSRARKAMPEPPKGPVSRNPIEPQDYKRS